MDTGENVAPMEKPWTGKTQIVTDESPKIRTPILDEPVPSSSSSSNKEPVDKPSCGLPVIISADTRDTKEPKDDDPFIDPPPTLPIAMARIHKRLYSKKELLKPQMKHHHMSFEQSD